ncbi:MAG TPA: cellulase family glycosylhydrolase [Anaeromyxobacter sp.]|nr:cellulase family glycosylhydrolase [Anaeromyxobacter sp.]
MKTFTKHALASFVALVVPVAALSQTALPTAPQVAAQINVGWNIGNSMEVPGGETLWGNPPVNQTLINAVKAAGFNSVRIPAAWDSHANQTTYQIDAAWLARVKEVVDYAVSQNMYVVLNIHWDGGWLEEHPLYAYQTAVNAKQKAYWTQIANYFKAYDQRLLFAGTNEVHADYGTPTAEHIEVFQSYLQTFVDAVRATGGNNATRPLVVQTYNTNIWHGLDFFTLPRDPAGPGRQIVEVHYYDPYDYTLNPSGPCLAWGAAYTQYSNCSWAQESYVDDTFARVKAEWVDQGVPVIIGEYGVATRPNLNLASRAYWLKYINQAAARNGIKTYYWDNGVSPSQTNGFALFDRNTGAVVDQAALDGVIQGAGVGNPNVTYTLTTSVNGSGTVARSPTGTSFPGGTVVTLTATPAAGYQFAGWTGDASGATNPISIRMNGNLTVVANFIQQGTGGSGTILREYWNNVTGTTVASLTSAAGYPSAPTGSSQLTALEGPTNIGDNYGTRVRGYIHPPISGAYTFWLASDDGGELWLGTSDSPGTATRIAYVDGWTDPRQWAKYPTQKSASINLTAGQKYYVEVLHKEATGGDHFAVSWSGPGMAQAVIGATYISPFVPTTGTTYPLTVTKSGTGTGTVTSSSGGISCGATCSATYASGTTVTLTAAAASGSAFGGWSGACTGTALTCSVSMTAARTVTATFSPSTTPTYTLTVTKSGTGTGVVTSTPAGISCGAACAASFASGATVTLSAAIASNSTFAGWSGACTGTAATCTVSMTAARTVTATFTSLPTYPLTVTKAGTGSGTVTSSPAGIDCGTACSASYGGNVVVVLTATAAAGSTFAGWSGACTGTAATCSVSMTAARTATATFNPSGTGTTPCANPVTFTSNTGNFNTTGAVCYRTAQRVNGWGCSNFAGRTVSVNGGTATATCGAGPFPLAQVGGYTYFSATAGSYPWASIYIW